MKHKNKQLFIALILLLSFLCANQTLAKRTAPKEVDPVIYKGIKYSASPFYNKMGYIEAWDIKTNKKLWEKKAYSVEINEEHETDVQMVFITKLSIKDNNLIIKNEAGDEYIINLNTTENYSFVLKLPPDKKLKEKYKHIKHELSKKPEYHFTIGKNKEWKTVNIKPDKDPESGKIYDVALFRKLDKNNQPVADINIQVTKVPSDTIPAKWLDAFLKNSYNKYKLQFLNKRTVKSVYGPVDDILFKYNYQDKTFISRIMAFRIKNNKLYIYQATTDEENYSSVAEDFFVSMATFVLTNPR